MEDYKFEDLLRTQTLYLPNILSFRKCGDKLEGEIPIYDKMHMGSGYIKIDDIEIKDPDLKVKSINYVNHSIFINCWGMDKKEVRRKWNEYAKLNSGIAIRSSIGRLKKALEIEQNKIYIGKVNYISHGTYIYNKPDPFGYSWLKDISQYEWEHEVRLLALYGVQTKQRLDTIEKFKRFNLDDLEAFPFIRIRCKLEELIDSIYLSPWANEQREYDTKNILNSYSLHKEVKKSFFKGKFDEVGNLLDL